MTGLISAELLRLRTVTAHHWGVLGVIALIAVNAAFGGVAASPDEVTAQVRGLVQVGVVLIAACAAYLLAEEFRRGSAALTYLRHPVRVRVAAAQGLTYAAVGGILAPVIAAVALGIVLTVAAGDGVDSGLSAGAIAVVLGGAAIGGATLGAAGTLVGAVTRNPGVATAVVAGWNLFETLLTKGGTRSGAGAYLPFQLVGAATGLSDRVAVLPAIAVLTVELAVLALAVRRWALPRDLT